jgi:hypothetical protein
VTATVVRHRRQRRVEAPVAPAVDAAGIRRLFEAPGRAAHVDARARSLRRLAARWRAESCYADSKAECDEIRELAARVDVMAAEAARDAAFTDSAPAMGQGYDTKPAGAGNPRAMVMDLDGGAVAFDGDERA